MELAPSTYEIRAVRCGGWWALECPALDGVRSYARTLSQAETIAREAIAQRLHVEPDSVDVAIGEVGFADASVATLIANAQAERARAEAAADRAKAALKAAVGALADLGLTVRDTGRVLDPR